MQQGDWVNSLLKGTVGGSFVASAKEAGLTSSEISAVIKAMQWQMDFRKLKKGDEFSVLMSREMLDGKREQSQLLGVRMRSDGKDYYAIRAADGKFYDRNGVGRRKAFTLPDRQTVPHLLQLQSAPSEPGYRTRCAASWR